MNRYKIGLAAILMAGCLELAMAGILNKPISFIAAPGYEFFEICGAINVNCGIELAAESGRDTEALEVSSMDGEKALSLALRRYPGHRWSVSRGILHVRPKVPIENSPLNRRLSSVRFEAKTLAEIAKEMSAMLKIGGGSYSIGGSATSNADAKKISVTGERLTVRDMLDKVVQKHGHAMWIMARRKRPSYPDHYSLQLVSY